MNVKLSINAGSAKIVVGLMLIALGGFSQATLVDFERLTSGPNAGNIYADLGVNFSSGSLAGTVAVGNTVTFAPNLTSIFGYGPTNVWSGSWGGYAQGVDDLMMTFDVAWNRVSLLTDKSIEDPQLVRLMALRSLGGNNYEVLTFAEALDNGTSLAQCLMSLTSTTAFSHVVFEATTEQEGIDDLEFGVVPEPGTLAALGLGWVAFSRRRRAG